MSENMTMKTGVYAIVNLLNGKMYIGSAAVNFSGRFRQHRSRLQAGRHHSKHLQSAWDKYGPGAFLFLPFCAAVPDEVLSKEQEYLDFWRPAYNILPNAGSNRGHKLNDEQKARKSASSKAMWTNQKVRERNTASIKEVQNRPAIKAAKSAATTAAWKDPDRREARLEALKLAIQKPEFSARVSAGTKQALSAKNVRERLSEAQVRLWADPEKRARRMESLIAACADPENRKRNSEAQKARWADPEKRAALVAAQTGGKRRAKAKTEPARGLIQHAS